MVEGINKDMEEKKTVRHFVVGDTHGCGKTVEKLMKTIEFDEKKDHVYFLGDYYGAPEKDDHVNLLRYLDQYYQPDLTKPGFHLLRGNHEWWNKHTTFLNDVWGNIKVAKLPDIVVLKINNKTFVLSHSGMHQEIWDEIKLDCKTCIHSAYQLDTSWGKNSSCYKKYYEAIIFTPKDGDITYYDSSEARPAEYWPKENGDNTYFIHGHFPITQEQGMRENYNYKKIGKTGVRYNEVRHAYNIDTGIKEHNELSCICLEDLKQPIAEKAMYTEKYDEGVAETNISQEYIDVKYEIKKIGIDNDALTVKKCELFSNLTIEEKLIKIKNKIEDNSLSEENKNFIKAMYRLATLGVNDLNEDVSDSVNKIKEYISNSSSANAKVNNMFGFNNSDFSIPTKGSKGYYFFLADLKIKCTVYILRIYNFIMNWDRANTAEKQRDDFVSLVENTKIDAVRKFFGIPIESQETTFIELVENKERLEKIEDLEDKNKVYKEFCEKILEFLETNNYSYQNEVLGELCQMYNSRINEIEDYNLLKDIPSFQSGKLFFNSTNPNNNLEKEYYLFDNSMKEINFVGIQWKWLWRYERDSTDLFRCVGTDEFIYDGKYDVSCKDVTDGRKYYQTMIKNIVSHMNSGEYKSKLASYSKNPFRDIYKYMNIRCEEKTNRDNSKGYFFVVTKGDSTNEKNTYIAKLIYGKIYECKEKNVFKQKREEGELLYENNKNTVTFALVKKANTNIVKTISPACKDEANFKIKDIGGKREEFYKVDNTHDTISFSQLIKESKDSEYGFCIDILNNKALYTGDVRNVFKKYVTQFPGDKHIKGLQLNIVASSDEEVVMLGNTCDAILNLQDNHELNYDKCIPNQEYRLNLNAKEMLYLFYEMNKITNNKKISIKMQECKDDGAEGYKKYSLNQSPIYAYVEDVFEEEKNEFNIISNSNQQMKTSDIAKKRVAIQEAIKAALIEILESYTNEAKNKVEFICSFLEQNAHKKSPDYGSSTYRDDDDNFIRFCRNCLLK